MGKLHIQLTADWEGQHFSNLNDFIALRKKIGFELPITHFICPSYFLRYPGAKQKINSALGPNDEIALHIHPLRDLIKYCGVPFRTEANFYRPNEGIIPSRLRIKMPHGLQKIVAKSISGRGVPLSVYTYDELKTIIAKSKILLEDGLGIDSVIGFRAGGNMANDNVLAALQELGFKYDSSAFPPEILSQGYAAHTNGNHLDNYGDKNGLFTEYVIKLWGSETRETGFLANKNIVQNNPDRIIQKTTQPFKIGNLWEMPINGGMSDFATPVQTFMPTYKILLKKAENETKNPYLNFGFHLEGEVLYKEAVWRFVKGINNNNHLFCTANQNLE